MESKLNEDALIQLVADNPGISRKQCMELFECGQGKMQRTWTKLEREFKIFIQRKRTAIFFYEYWYAVDNEIPDIVQPEREDRKPRGTKLSLLDEHEKIYSDRASMINKLMIPRSAM
jgi:hypothetical protein